MPENVSENNSLEFVDDFDNDVTAIAENQPSPDAGTERGESQADSVDRNLQADASAVDIDKDKRIAALEAELVASKKSSNDVLTYMKSQEESAKKVKEANETAKLFTEKKLELPNHLSDVSGKDMETILDVATSNAVTRMTKDIYPALKSIKETFVDIYAQIESLKKSSSVIGLDRAEIVRLDSVIKTNKLGKLENKYEIARKISPKKRQNKTQYGNEVVGGRVTSDIGNNKKELSAHEKALAKVNRRG